MGKLLRVDMGSGAIRHEDLCAYEQFGGRALTSANSM